MSGQAEINDMKEYEAEVAASAEPEDNFVELNNEARISLALYLNVSNNGGKVTKEGTLVPPLNVHKLSRMAEVNERTVSKCMERIRNKGFLANNTNGQLVIPDWIEFTDWLKAEGAVVD